MDAKAKPIDDVKRDPISTMKPTLTDREAIELSEMVSAPDMFPDVRKSIVCSLISYYKCLLYRPPHPPIPTPRRWR